MGWKDTIQSIHRAGGLRMFWVGNTPALLRVAPLTGLKFALFEPLFGYWTVNPEASLYKARFISGAFASGTTSLLLYPLDVLKTQVTVVKLTCLASKQPIPALPSWTAAQSLWQRGGLSGVTRGIGISTIGAAFHGGLIFMAYQR